MEVINKILNSKEKIHIGLDIHGVIDASPTFFALITNLLGSNGHTVSILTGAQIKPKIVKELTNYGLYWDNLFSISDFHITNGTPVSFKDSDNPFIDDDLWDKTKALWCDENNVDIMIDDTKRYGQYFTNTEFIHWNKIK